MQTPPPFSFEAMCAAAGTPVRAEPVPYIAACHSGADARALEASYRAQLAELETHGRNVLRRFSPSQLASALYAAVYVEQLQKRLRSLDIDALEDLAGLILRLEHDDDRSGQ